MNENNKCFIQKQTPKNMHIEYRYSQVPNKRVYSFIPKKKVGLLF